MKPKDKVITTVQKLDVPEGTFGVVHSIDESNIWVAVYMPEDSTKPYDIITYREGEVKPF